MPGSIIHIIHSPLETSPLSGMARLPGAINPFSSSSPLPGASMEGPFPGNPLAAMLSAHASNPDMSSNPSADMMPSQDPMLGMPSNPSAAMTTRLQVGNGNSIEATYHAIPGGPADPSPPAARSRMILSLPVNTDGQQSSRPATIRLKTTIRLPSEVATNIPTEPAPGMGTAPRGLKRALVRMLLHAMRLHAANMTPESLPQPSPRVIHIIQHRYVPYASVAPPPGAGSLRDAIAAAMMSGMDNHVLDPKGGDR